MARSSPSFQNARSGADGGQLLPTARGRAFYRLAGPSVSKYQRSEDVTGFKRMVRELPADDRDGFPNYDAVDQRVWTGHLPASTRPSALLSPA